MKRERGKKRNSDVRGKDKELNGGKEGNVEV
jgi:hypothetical protein